jgi:hypothetical protein
LRLDCGPCVVRDWARSDKASLVRQSPVFEWNPASMRVLEKCGFAREAVLRASVSKDGELIDSVLYAFVDTTLR